ncbi:hypothetical protein T4E_2553 [Trichinella pseudospiralis]|uniref:Uncharacterized protein n=1 Tax=Trichinella pseudospiralis TaxID=6337 RepID=A0A0V0Y0F9_TRIPS|nr:hypothetical protein T4E_2553 [Trichinella pseudospiralis]
MLKTRTRKTQFDFETSLGSLLRVDGQSCATRGRSTQGYMLNWGSEKKTFTENEEAFKNFDHMLEFDHVRYQMCVPRTSAKSETSMVENPYVDNGWAERAPKLAPQGQLWYLPFQAEAVLDQSVLPLICEQVLVGARQIWTLSVVQFFIAVDEWSSAGSRRYSLERELLQVYFREMSWLQERLVYFMNQSSRRDNTQVLQYENEQRCGLSL